MKRFDSYDNASKGGGGKKRKHVHDKTKNDAATITDFFPKKKNYNEAETFNISDKEFQNVMQLDASDLKSPDQNSLEDLNKWRCNLNQYL